MQLVIDSCKAAGVMPVIARLIATNPTQAGWQVNIAYETTIDSLTKVNKLIAGPDLYTYFLNNPSEHNSDGIHPNATGAASIQRLWAQKMDSLYTAPPPQKAGRNGDGRIDAKFYSVIVNGLSEIHALSAALYGYFQVTAPC